MFGTTAGTIVVWSDLGCPWAHVAVARLHRYRADLHLEDAVRIDHRPFALELANERPTPKSILDAEIPVAGALEPDAGWQMWQEPAHEWPVTTLLALEAVQAAKEQGLEPSEQLDRALRAALFAESRCISMRHVVLEVARSCPTVDAAQLEKSLDRGAHRQGVIESARAAIDGDRVNGSPHLFLPDGTDVHNPGIRLHWCGEHGRGFPVVDSDDPSVYGNLLRTAAASST